MEENPVTQKPNEKTVKQRRLSSILKAPRIPLQDLGNDCKQDFFPDVPRKRSRRVSFALPIKVHDSPLSASEDGQIDGAGMDTLLHAPIQTQPQQDQYEESNETLGNRTILFSGEDNDLTLSDTLLSVNISEKSQIDMKTSKIDFTSFLASLSSEKKSQSKEVFTSGTQSTSTNTTFFNDPSKDSSNFGNKISVNQFLASLKSTARPTHAVLESEEKENLGESALRLHGGKSKVSSVTSYSPVFPLIQESLHICKDKDQALDLTECHIANSETFICTDDLTKPLQGMISSQKMKMDISKSKPATNRKFESKFNCPQILSMHSLQGGNSGFDFGNKTVYCDDMDLTNSHTVCIERANVSINQNPQGLPLMNRERAPTATFCPGENTMIFHESEQNLDITNSLTSWIGSNNPTGSSVSESTSQAARKDLSFAPEKTVHFLGDDMDVTRSHTVAFEMQKHELAFGDRETYRSSPSCISTVNHNLNGNSDCVRLNMTQNIASETAPVRPSSDEPLLLHMFEKKAVGLPCEDICVTENNTNLTLRLASELNLDSTLENTSCSLRLQNNTDVTKVFINENCELDLTHSHTTNMQTVLPAVMAIGSKSFEFCNTTSVVGDESTRVVNNLPNAQISKNHQVLGSTKDRKVDDIPVCYSSDISKEIHTGQPTDTKVTLVPSRFGIGEETVRIEESMDVTKTHSVLIGCDALEPENSSTGLDSESEDMDITKSHTVAIDGNVIESQMNKRTFQSMTSTERCTEETVQKNMTEVELMQASNVSQTNNVHCPRPGRSLVMHLSKNQTIDFLDEEMDHTDVVTSKSQNDLLSKTATGPKLRLPFKCQPDSPVGFTEDMELTKSHTYCFDQNIGKPAKELIPTIEKPVDDNSQTVPRHFDSFAEKLKLDNSTVSKKYNPKQILGLSLSMKSSVFEQEKMAIHPNQSSQAIGKSELHNINAQQSCAYPQDDACNKTQLFRGTDDSLDITQCHTTNIERWTPVDERINSEKSMAESNWLIVNEANTDVTHHDKVHVQGACEQNTCRISSVKSGIQHAGSEIGCQWSSGITVDERDGISVDTTNMHKQNELKTSAVLPGNPVAQYPGNGFQSREASAFFISDDMEITRNNTVAISNRPPKSTGCYSQEASGMHTSRLSMADHSMDLTKCHTVVIEKQNIGMSTPTNQPSQFLSNSKKRIAHLKGEFSDDSKEYVTDNQSHGKSVLYQLPNDKTLLLSEDMNMTNYCDPVTDASEKGRSVLPESSVLYSKGQQEMEMTASNTIFIDQNISMSEHLGTNLQKLCTHFPSNTSKLVNHGCVSESSSVISAVLPENPGAQYPGNCFQSREASAFFISDDMEITRNNTVAISNRPPKSTGCYSQEASGMHTSRLSMADHSMDLTKCHTVVIEKQNIGMSTPTNQPSLFLSNSKKRIANLKGEFSDDSKEYVTENQSHGKSVLYHLPNDKTLLLSEDMNMTNYCDPETDASEKGRSVLLERSVLYSKGQQEMEMTASNTIFIDQNISMSEHLGTNLQKLCTPFPSNTSEPVNHGCASASASVFPSPFKDNQATTNNRLEHPGFSKSSHSPHMTPLKMRYEGEISMPELVMDITKCHTVAIEQINAQRMHQPLATNESLQDPEDMAMDMDITKCHTIAIQKVDAQGILYNSGTEGMLADEELEITKNCSNDICVGNLRKSGCPPSIEVSSTKYTPEKCIHYSKDELMDVTRCHTMCIDQETNREPQGNAQQAFTSFRNNCANNPNRNLVTDEAVLNVTATQMEMDYNNIELFQQREQTGSDLVSVGVNCMSLQLMDHSPIASHAKQNKESGRISMGNTTLPVERDMTQPGETECDRLIGCILNTSGILNRESSGKTKIDTNKADDGSLNQNCNSEIPVSQLPARISAEESSLHAFPDRMGKDKSRRASLADIQSKIERLKRQSEGEATCHTSPVSHVTEQRPTSFPPVTNDHRRLETLDVEISGPEKHQLTNYSEEQEMILAKAGNSTTTVNTARGDTIRNETCTLKMLTLGFILPRLPNKRKSIASNAEDIDKPASVMAVSEMNTSSAKMPKSLPVATSLNAFETSTSCSIFEESPSFLEEGEPNSSLNDDVPKGACEELCEKEARPGLADGGLLANKPCGSQKRTLELPADEYQEEKKCRNAFEWLCESAGKQENQTFMNLVSNQTAETYQTNSTLSRSLLKNSSSSNTSSVDSRGDGTTRELSQQCSRTDSRFLLDSDEFNLHKRLQEGVITVKEFFMLINLSALIQKPRFSELPENNEGHAHLTPEEIMHDRYIHHPKLQIYEEDCQALCQIIDELKCSVCVQDKPLAKVNPSLWEVMVTCTESELKLFGEKMRTIKSSYTLKSKVLAHKAKVKRYGQLLETSRNRYEELQSTIDDVDRLLQETDQCISALFHEAAQLEESTRDKCDSEAKGLQAELESLKSTEDEHKSDILNLERQKQAILTQISALQKETSQMDKRLSDYNFTEWKLSRWDDNSALFTFLYGSLELSITFGEPVDGVLFFGKPCRKISRVDFEFLLADEAPPSSLLCQRLILQFIGKKGSLPENNKTMLALPEFLFNISLVVTRCRHLAEEVEFLMKWHGKFNILKMEVHNSEVKMLFCSSVAFAKFEVIFSLSDNYPSSPLSFSVLKLIGRLGQGDISAVVSNVPPGPNYLKRAVQRIQRDLFL
ncbi:kinetochore scaffold 1 isoform X2 [Ambystoma mexicanum]|uniref:kinetochore scaffold 1 isoform X2 n=1 Tax=Ambystoma mexicanum TaxID=8296 RepID=UPI0037E915BB